MSILISYEFILTVIYILNFIVTLNLIFRERRNIQSTVAWVMLLNVVPAGGLLIYLIFGRRVSKKNMFKLKKEEDQILKSSLEETYKTIKVENCIENKDMIYALTNLGDSSYTTNNKIELFVESQKHFNELLDSLRKAKDYIHIQFYIFKDDNIGQEIINILLEKASQGVEVRLLYDYVGSRSLSDKTINRLKKGGCKVGAFYPSFMKVVNFNLNYRNHRKIVVIDKEVGFIGGFNVGDEYLGKNKKFGDWRDTHIKITGASVNDLNLRFMMDWRYTTREDIDFTKYLNKDIKHYDGNCGVQIVSSGPDLFEIDEIKFGYLKMINRAKKYIYIQTPYLILDATLLDALKLASMSGVDVRIMIPSKPDHPFVYWATYSYAGELLKFGARIYTYDKGSFLHAKTIVIDDEVCSIGTSNMDIRSFELNFEVNAFIYSKDVSISQRKIFEDDITKSKELTLDIYNNRSNKIRIKESISRLISPIL